MRSPHLLTNRSVPVTRRALLKSLGMGTGGMLLSGSTVSTVEARSARGIPYDVHGFDERRYGEETLIAQALEFLSYRLTSIDVLRYAYNLSGANYYFAGGIWEASRLDYQSQWDRAGLLWFQITSLAPRVPFVPIDITGYNRDSEEWGQGEIGTVTVVWNGPNWPQPRGRFRVRLNRYHLATPGSGSNLNAWAGTIAHEMLHNLGHLHDVGDYGISTQINAYAYAVSSIVPHWGD